MDFRTPTIHISTDNFSAKTHRKIFSHSIRGKISLDGNIESATHIPNDKNIVFIKYKLFTFLILNEILILKNFQNIDIARIFLAATGA